METTNNSMTMETTPQTTNSEVQLLREQIASLQTVIENKDTYARNIETELSEKSYIFNLRNNEVANHVLDMVTMFQHDTDFIYNLMQRIRKHPDYFYGVACTLDSKYHYNELLDVIQSEKNYSKQITLDDVKEYVSNSGEVEDIFDACLESMGDSNYDACEKIYDEFSTYEQVKFLTEKLSLLDDDDFRSVVTNA